MPDRGRARVCELEASPVKPLGGLENVERVATHGGRGVSVWVEPGSGGQREPGKSIGRVAAYFLRCSLWRSDRNHHHHHHPRSDPGHPLLLHAHTSASRTHLEPPSDRISPCRRPGRRAVLVVASLSLSAPPFPPPPPPRPRPSTPQAPAESATEAPAITTSSLQPKAPASHHFPATLE